LVKREEKDKIGNRPCGKKNKGGKKETKLSQAILPKKGGRPHADEIQEQTGPRTVGGKHLREQGKNQE